MKIFTHVSQSISLSRFQNYFHVIYDRFIGVFLLIAYTPLPDSLFYAINISIISCILATCLLLSGCFRFICLSGVHSPGVKVLWWLQDSDSDQKALCDLTSRGYKLTHLPRSSKKGGGVVVL